MIARRFSGLFLFALLVTVGCTKREVPLELNIHVPKVDLKLDPHKMEDAYSMLIVSQLHRGLLRFNSGGDVVSDLAESWTESSDRTTYRFKLRPGNFSNGEKITAKNVQLSFARIFLTGAGIGADLDYIEGAKELTKTKNLKVFGVRPISDNEVEFKLEHPSAIFLKHVAVTDCAIMPYQSFERIMDDPPGFSGPYKIEKNSKDEVKIIKWRPDALDSKAPPQAVRFFRSAEPAISLAKAGKTDSLDRDTIENKDKNEFKSNGWEEWPTELTGENFVILNPKYLSQDLRRYLYLKVDPVEIAKIIDDSHLRPAFGLIPNGLLGRLSADDVAHLRSEPATYTGKKVTFHLDCELSGDREKKIVDYLKSVWSSERITVIVNPLSTGEKLKKMFEKTSEAVLGRKGVDYPDGFSILTYFKGKYETNYFHVDDPAIDAAVSNSIREFDADKRGELYKNVELQVLKHFTYVPLLFGSQASGLWSSKVKMVPSHPMGYHTISFETIEMRTE